MKVSNEGDDDDAEADILLVDKPMNHLDIIDVVWVKKNLHSLTDATTSIEFTQASSTSASPT
jgi:hypothetical protein